MTYGGKMAFRNRNIRQLLKQPENQCYIPLAATFTPYAVEIFDKPIVQTCLANKTLSWENLANTTLYGQLAICDNHDLLPLLLQEEHQPYIGQIVTCSCGVKDALTKPTILKCLKNKILTLQHIAKLSEGGYMVIISKPDVIDWLIAKHSSEYIPDLITLSSHAAGALIGHSFIANCLEEGHLSFERFRTLNEAEVNTLLNPAFQKQILDGVTTIEKALQ
jgi:hypothetical protein